MWTGSGVRLAVSPMSTSPGGTVTATWSSLQAPTSADRLSLYRRGRRGEAPALVDWLYVSCARLPADSRAFGSCPLPLPADLAPGRYEVRLLAADGRRLATSNILTIPQP